MLSLKPRAEDTTGMKRLNPSLSISDKSLENYRNILFFFYLRVITKIILKISNDLFLFKEEELLIVF